MPRSKHALTRHKRRKKVLKAAKGFWGDRSKRYRHAKEALAHALVYAYRDRKNKKRDFRRLWITRISAACRQAGLTYSQFMNGLKKSKIALNRKMLAELAVRDIKAFDKLIEMLKK